MTSKVWEVMNDLEMITSKICSAREIIDTAVESIQKHDYDKAETLAMAAYEFLGYYLDEFDVKFKLAWQETVVKQKEEDPCMPPWGHSDLEYALKQNKDTDKKYWDIHTQSVKTITSCDRDDPSSECKGAWDSFWEDTPSTKVATKADGYSVDSMFHSEYYYDYSRNDPNRLNPFGGKIYESPDGGKTVYSRNIGETERTIVKEDKVIKWQLPVEMDGPSGEYFVSFPDDLLKAANLEEGDQVEWVDKGDGSYLLRKVIQPLRMDEC